MEARRSSALAWLEADHELLLLLTDSVVTAAGRADDHGTVQEILLTLVDASTEHFSSEQELMQALAYPAYEEHAAEHDWFLDRVEQMLESGNRGDLASVGTMARALRPWLADHTRSHDSELVSFVYARTSGGDSR